MRIKAHDEVFLYTRYLMTDLSDRIQQANTLLAPYAVPHEGTLGRSVREEPDATRFPFQRDRDRIIFTKAYRRLKGKTQVFVSGIGDHYRTRLTHTTEVVMVSRNIARTLRLNEDLAECIGLAHDLGHPPFGHAGEEALNHWMQKHNSSFEHNLQSLRIVETLAEHSERYTGLNLNQEVLEGLMKHRTPYDVPQQHIERHPSLEALVVNIADEISYTAHDIDDGLPEGLFTLQKLLSVPLIAEITEKQGERTLLSILIDTLVSDLYAETTQNIEQKKIMTLHDVYEQSTSPIDFSTALRSKLDILRAFLWDNMYMHPAVKKRSARGQEIVIALCEHFLQNPHEQIQTLQKRNGSSLIEAVKDYVSGMTDAYAEQSFLAL